MTKPFLSAAIWTLAAAGLLVAAAGCGPMTQQTEAGARMGEEQNAGNIPTVRVRLFNENGELAEPAPTPRAVKSEEQWRQQLTAEQFRILREAGTERAGTGALLRNNRDGVYACAGCMLPLFDSRAKYDSGTGWPSYFQPIARENVAERPDNSLFMRRTEVICARCEGHLGHVFNDGPRPTGLRYCMNSGALTFVPRASLATLAEASHSPSAAAQQSNPTQGNSAAAPARNPGVARAVFAGGCFWCVEAVFQELDGVRQVVSGYAGGRAETANYEAVVTGRTRHAEVVQVTYDPREISYEDLLRVHFATHDPTQLNRQGNDIGPQYRSAIFYANEEERSAAERMIRELSESGMHSRPIVTTLEPLDAFYTAEAYHQNFVINNPNHPYVRNVALPKIEKVRGLFPEGVREDSPLRLR